MYEFSTNWVISEEDLKDMVEFSNKVLKPRIQKSSLRFSSKLLLEMIIDNKLTEIEIVLQRQKEE
jgi:hypothetical protein